MEAVRAAQAAPAALHLQDRRGELRLQRRLRHPAGALRQEYRPRGRPIWDADKKVIGFIDVLHKRAFEAGPKGERIEIDVPDDKKPVLDELYDALKESVAETSEELMDKYFSGEDFTYAEMIQGLRQGVKDLSLFPVVCGSAVSGLGTRMLLDIIVELLPSPLEGRPLMGENADGEVDEFVPFPGACPPPWCGRLSPTSTASTPS